MASGKAEPVPIRPGLEFSQRQAKDQRRRHRWWLIGGPVFGFCASLVLGLSIVDVNSLMAAIGLLAAAFLGVFVQLANWRTRLSARIAWHRNTEAFDRVRLDVAVKLTLRASVVSFFLACSLAVFGMRSKIFERLQAIFGGEAVSRASIDTVGGYTETFFTAIFLAAVFWLLIAMFVIARALRFAYLAEAEGEEKESDNRRAVSEFRRHG